MVSRSAPRARALVPVPAPVLPVLLVLVLACAHAAIYRRCTQVQEGRVLSGDETNQDPRELAPEQRRYTIPLPPLPGCDAGWVVTACDLVPPEVVISDELDSVSVLRLGPMWMPATLQLTQFCTPVLPTTSAGAPTATTAAPAPATATEPEATTDRLLA